MVPLISIIIPTRNRPEIVICAIESIINGQNLQPEIIVSDNSDEEYASTLSELLKHNARFNNIVYIRPDKILPMADHWEWAIQHAKGEYIGILTDRMVYKHSALDKIACILTDQHPKVLSFLTDTYHDYAIPGKLKRRICTHKVYDYSSSVLLDLSASSKISAALPRMLNSFVRRDIIDEIRSKYDSVFDSISPDYGFCYRVLDWVDFISIFDYSALIQHSLNRSNGINACRNISNKDVSDFTMRMEGNEIIKMAPLGKIPPIPINAILMEYENARLKSKNNKFKPIDKIKFYNRAKEELVNQARKGYDLDDAINDIEYYREKNNLLIGNVNRYESNQIGRIKSIIFNSIRMLVGPIKMILTDKFNIWINGKYLIDLTSKEFNTIDDVLEFERKHPRKAAKHLDKKRLNLV